MTLAAAGNMRLGLFLGALLGAGCVPESGPLMEAGADCLECHGGSGGEEEARAWSVAGTMGGKGSRVVVTDATGWTFTLHAARNGNFYTAEDVAYPIRVAVDGEEMADAVPSPLSTGACIESRCCTGSRCGCNDCHGDGRDGGGD